jgi:REP element-mobilizing transposase RayT
MKYDPDKHHRRSIRLKGYNYSQAGAYFVTIVAYQRECLFGEIVDGEMVLNELGRLVEKWWHRIPVHFPNVEILLFVIMPNHIHGIIVITDGGRGAVSAPDDGLDDRGEMTSPLRQPTLGQIVAYFKYQSTKEMNAMDGTGTITKFWQRNYYERIIRDEREMDHIHRYIVSNPSMWADDDENPAKTKT